MTLEEIKARVTATGIGVVGAFHPEAEDSAPAGIATLILLGPAGPEMWHAFQTAPEYGDGAPHPMDRWSERVIGGLATKLDAQAFFPFGGPPWQPFQKWAVTGEGAVSSPVSMQATMGRGLWTSYRGALGFRERLALPDATKQSPCLDCKAPCLTACPVDAFSDGTYNVPRCVEHLQQEPRVACRNGCLVRTACPYGGAISLPVKQRAFHIDAFLRANG
jgi:hypothetical protein